jgi:retron-type reverse transcriptase
MTRNFGEKRLTGAIFLDVAKAFDTVWVDGLLFKLTTLNFPSYLLKIICSYLHNRTFEAAFLTDTSTRRRMRAGVAQGGLVSPVLFSLHVNDMPVPSRHVELVLYADDTAIIATSRKSALLIST